MVRVYACGAGMVPFTRPNSGRGYQNMASEAAAAALKDAKVSYKEVNACVCSYNYAAPTAGQSAVYKLGLTGVPIFNTNNNCSSGSANLFLARNLIQSGQYDVILCIGFEEMDGGLSEPFQEKASPTARQFEHMYSNLGMKTGKVAMHMNDFTSDIIKLFAEAGSEYCKKHGVSETIFAEIAAKNRMHGQSNPNAMLASSKAPPTAEQIAAQPKLFGCLSSGMAAPTGDGAAAVLLCSDRWVSENCCQGSSVELLGQALVSDTPETFGSSVAALAGLEMARLAAEKAYAEAGVVPADIGVVELHDCFSPNELLLYEALKLAGPTPGTGAAFWQNRRCVKNSHGIDHIKQGAQGLVVNPSGGLESKGHPIGATGLGQAAELIAQLRGDAGKRQIEPRPRIAVQHNFGFNGGAVVSVWAAPVAVPRPLSSLELDKAKIFAAGWGNGTELTMNFSEGQGLQGQLPRDLRGTFFRNGPGLIEVHGTRLIHPIDGDGLIGRLTFFGDGSASFSARFVQTATHVKEEKAKAMIYPGQMGSRAPSKEAQFRDPSHTNVFEWGGKLLSCHEYTLPHELDPRTLRTLGPTDLNGTLKKTRSLCAHFRYDKVADRLVTVSFRTKRPALGGPARPSQLHVCEFDRAWKLQKEVYHEINGLNYCHDLAVTPSFYIVHQTPFVKVDLDAVQKILSNEETPGEQMKYHAELPCRLILIPRDGGNPVLVDLPEPCHVYHFGHAFEREGLLEVDIVALGKRFTMQFQHELWLSNADEAPGLLYTVRVDLASGRCVSFRQADSCSCEFPAVHPHGHVVGKEEPSPRYTYLMANDDGLSLPFTHVVKADRLGEGRQSYCFEGCSVGEPCFLPRATSSNEDDGYIVVQVFEPRRHETSFAVLDAQHLSRGPICTLNLQAFLPNAFHGTWCETVYGDTLSRL
mmetsp:Transcript_40683/g.73304  ORF Transcript_40683/g.73304 Transcript_40683/m.73304 type:complete len:922 (+) Transcript_40683:90-2855(+)|eukprot:CAMPEP_0197697528 /NCGR_PEP_ID=MMETSP1338-20131121/118084_1 /TAXON_ID=43686 ORGANISM="Pelagodinium beii, Strain RCC1491" /NCGR_SAMPLE_ID=MMETSP1338 /ASSEMBLY_ACC=CAM_ASM_000754 /LENGTH=921 /DNA_ID=CAMNT_0043280789 /DNA_START=26 /DNA_END=2791 /DNA_ORIENTATION=+